jgi:hypothetical protein
VIRLQDGWDLILMVTETFFYYCIQTYSGPRNLLFSGSEAISLEAKQLEAWSYHSHSSSANVKYVCSSTSTSPYISIKAPRTTLPYHEYEMIWMPQPSLKLGTFWIQVRCILWVSQIRKLYISYIHHQISND